MAVPRPQRLLCVVRATGKSGPARRPIIVVQTLTDSAVAIAASYAAKAFGIKTGTLMRDARQLCPAVIPVQANHRLYTEYHERILKAVDTCLPVENVCSIDEMACKLMGTERQVPAARQLAVKVKQALREQVGECLTCSIGIAPNVFLGKVGSDLQKPDGLVVITKADLPGILLGLQLQDIYGIGSAWSSGCTAPASSMSSSCGRQRRTGYARCGAGSTGCCFTRCCTASISSRRRRAIPKASAISMCWSRTCARRKARTILRSIC